MQAAETVCLTRTKSVMAVRAAQATAGACRASLGTGLWGVLRMEEGSWWA